MKLFGYWKLRCGHLVKVLKQRDETIRDLNSTINRQDTRIVELNETVRSLERGNMERPETRGIDETQNLPIEHLSDSVQITDNDINSQIERIKEIGDVKSVSVDGNKLIIITKNINIKYRNVNYNLGCYKITIDGNDVDIRSLRIKKILSGAKTKRYHHPHFYEYITGNDVGKMSYCFGTFREAFNVMDSDNKFMRVFMLIKYLRSYNERSPFEDIERFK